MKFSRFLIASVVIIMVFATSVMAFSWPWEWFRGDREEEQKRKFYYEFDSGWRILTIKPAWESPRVRNFDYKFASDHRRLERIVGYGNFKLYYEMYFMSYQNWWLMAVDIPSDNFLYIPKNKKITMKAISQGDTVYVDSERICFCKGWEPREYQHTLFDNSEGDIHIKPYKGIGREDFEHGNVEGYDEEFTIGYIYFGKDIREIDKVIDFSFSKEIRCPESDENKMTRR